MPKTFPWIVLALWIVSACRLWADGGPVTPLPGTDILIPVHVHEALLLDRHVTITLPKPQTTSVATIRTQYLLAVDNAVKKPMLVDVGWPTQGIVYGMMNQATGQVVERVEPPYLLTVTLDGKPVPCSLLSGDELAAQYLRPLMQRRDHLLSDKPELNDKVKEIRGQAPADHPEWLSEEGASALSQWMQQRKLVPTPEADKIVAGLLAVKPTYENGEALKRALGWLDPALSGVYAALDYKAILADRWGFKEVMVDPRNGRLIWGGPLSAMGPGEDWGMFRFTITLLPGKRHKLVVQYGQAAYNCTSEAPDGWSVLMESVRSWGLGAEGTTEIRVPRRVPRVAILPRAKKVRVAKGYTIYRIKRGATDAGDADNLTHDNLYVSTGGYGGY